MQVEKMDAYLKLKPVLDRSFDHIEDYEELVLKEIDPQDLDLYLNCAKILGDWVNYTMISYVFRGFEGFLLAYGEIDPRDAVDVFLVSVRKVEGEPDFKDILPLYLTSFFNQMMERFEEAKSSKEYRSIIDELKMIDQFHSMGRFVLKTVLENAMTNFPNRPALQKAVAQALEEVEEESSPMEELMEEASKGDKKHFFNTIANWILQGPLFITKQLPKIKGRKFSPLSQVGLLYTKDDETFIPVFTKEENVLTTFSDEMGYYVEEVDPKELILEYEQKDFLDHPIVINPFNQAILLNDELYSYLLDKVHMEKKEKGENIIDIRPYIHKKHD